VYLLGRALGGVQDPHHGTTLIDQLWLLVSTSLLHHNADDACRRSGAQFFLNVLPHLRKEGSHPIEGQMLDASLSWYEQGIAPEILVCCSRIIARQRGNAMFESSAHQAFEVRTER
jgi:hypothetical protein